MASDRIAIKGIGESLLIILGEGELPELLEELIGQLEETPAFFEGAKVALEVGSRELSVEEIKAVRRLLARRKVSLQAVISESARTKAAAYRLGLDTSLHPRAQPKPGPSGQSSQGVLLRCTLRSGQVVKNPGHVVIVGDVNPGAEVIAGGDIIVWGKLRGTAHAGAIGDEGAVVCALQMSPTQLRIANYVACPPEEQRDNPVEPEMASIQDGRVVVEPWR